jgi:hypothetical protein
LARKQDSAMDGDGLMAMVIDQGKSLQSIVKAKDRL